MRNVRGLIKDRKPPGEPSGPGAFSSFGAENGGVRRIKPPGSVPTHFGAGGDYWSALDFLPPRPLDPFRIRSPENPGSYR